LREIIQKKQAKEERKTVYVDKLAEERNKNAYVSENFFVPKDRQQSRGKPDQRRHENKESEVVNIKVVQQRKPERTVFDIQFAASTNTQAAARTSSLKDKSARSSIDRQNK